MISFEPRYDRVEYAARLARAHLAIIEEQDRKVYDMLYGKEEPKMNSKSQMKREAVQRGKSLEEEMTKAHGRGEKFSEQFDEHQTELLLGAQKKKEREAAERFMHDLVDSVPLAGAELEHISGMRLTLLFLPPVGSHPGQKYEEPDLQEALDELIGVACSGGFKETLLGAVGGCVSVKVS